MIATIEIPKSSRYKYEISEGTLTLDRVIRLRYPHNYGFVPNTIAADHDPLDVFVLSREPILPCCNVEVTVLGAFLCEDNGVPDHKLVAMVSRSGEVQVGWKRTLRTFLRNYKEGFKVLEYVGRDKALAVLQACRH